MFVYAVTSYTAPSQTVRLVARLRRDSPESRIIVSHDRKMPPPPVDALAAIGAELRLTAEPITWGDASYLRSQLAVIAAADLGEGDWLTFLSGQDYPLHRLRDFERHLVDCGADMLLEEPDTDGDPTLPALLRRYTRRSYRMPYWADRHRLRQIVGRLPGWELGREPRGLPPYLHRTRLMTPFGPTFVLYKGADLFALSGRAARVLLSAPPALLRYYAKTRIPSESYVHTVLRNASSLRNRNEMLHFARWTASPHPDWLTLDDLDDMCSSGRWFARKFRDDDPVLDVLDAGSP